MGLLREAKTLSAVLDLLALDQPREAAMEFVTKEGGSWGVAKFVEMAPQDGAALMEKPLRTMAKTEYKDDISRATSALGGRPAGRPAAEVPAGRSKGKGEAASWHQQPWVKGNKLSWGKGKAEKDKGGKGQGKPEAKVKADKGKTW